ncbi:hypothetical protein EC991_010389 [Linnemannia zychae]|nr:hypothetical protein EC991_010389 [Linnemannia zychae]
MFCDDGGRGYNTVNDLYIRQDDAGEGDNSDTNYPSRKRITRSKAMSSSKFKNKKINNSTSKHLLYKFQLQRLEDSRQANLQSSDNDVFSLVDKVQEFLASDREVMLILGDSGSGKSTFNLQLEHTFWKSYKYGDPIPLPIHLPNIDNPLQNLIGKILQELDFTDEQIKEYKKNWSFIVTRDGYDESQLNSNIHTSNP